MVQTRSEVGVPLTSKRICANNCKSLIDKIKNKVYIWKSKCLSYAGRLLLIASVLESIHVYWASVFLFPKSVMNDINKLLKWFLWNQWDKAKVAWKNICRPKSKGGLGLKDLGVWNKAMIVKHLWHIITNKETLWVKWINTVKLKSRSIWTANEETNDSWGWKNIIRMRDEVRKFIVIKIGNGEKAYVIYVNWCRTGALQSFITHRDLYNVRWHDKMVVKDIVENGVCIWPEE
ncbi:hypothetical protein Tco_1235747 [Tanacetum coccineum]